MMYEPLGILERTEAMNLFIKDVLSFEGVSLVDSTDLLVDALVFVFDEIKVIKQL